MEELHEPKLLCVPFKESHSTDKVRRRILKRLKKLERKSSSSTFVKSLSGLASEEILATVSNSKYLGFLLKDGRVCRMRVSSTANLTTHQVPADIKSAATGGTGETSFQVLSDAEYARRLQAQFDQERELRPSSRYGRDLDMIRGLHGSLSPYVSISNWTPSTPATLGSNTNYSPTSPTQEFPGNNPAYLPTALTFLNPPSSVVTLRAIRQFGDGATPVSNSDSMDIREVPETKVRFNVPSDESAAAAVAAAAAAQKKEVVWPDMGELEWLVVKQNPDSLCSDNRFVSIVALHSEFLLVGGASGQLYSWPCVEGMVNPQPHPLVGDLGLSSERIALISSSDIRVSLVTESGGVATFYDQLLRGCSENGTPPLVSSLSHSIQFHPEFVNDSISSLSVSEFITFAVTATGKVFWWGLCPQVRSQPSSSDNRSSSQPNITEGSLVRLKNGPPCGPNALVLQCSKTHGPRVAQTVNIIERSSIDPTTSVLVKVLRQTGNDISLQTKVYECLEVWKQAEVVFLDDSPAVLGRVVAVDNNQAIIDVSYAQHTDIQSTSKPQSSLKVYRLAELSLCMAINVNMPESTSSGSGHSLSRHVAGVVQHHPICLLDPAPSSGPSLPIIDDGIENGKGSVVLRGFLPLAVHPTNTGPYLLVKRIQDDQSFFVCTSGTSSGLLQTSSYVAVGGADSKPYKCTMEEESCHAKECGFEAWFTETPPANEVQKFAGRKRKRKAAAVIQSSVSESVTARGDETAQRTASLVDMFNSEILCIKDIHGILIPIPPGLKLKPDQPRYLDHLSGWFPNQDPVLARPYHSVLCRQYTIHENRNVVLLLVVPQIHTLLPSVMKIDTIAVERIVRSISKAEKTPHQLSADENEAVPVKKMALESPESLDVEMNELKQLETSETSMNVDTDDSCPPPTTKESSPAITTTTATATSDNKRYSTSVLYEYTAYNFNVLHACVARKDTEDDMPTKQFIPYKADNGANYQSLTAYMEYRDTSFEELRQAYYSRGGYEISADMKRDWQDLAYAQIMMLETFLSCEAIRSDIIALLCQKNSFGETPFMTALSHQNFTGAHKILDFVDELSSTHKNLFKDAIMARNRQGMTAIQVYFASYSNCYDILYMRMYVSSLPLGYTAQQLLALFKEFYPSAYKAEVTKDYDDDDIVDTPEDSTDPDSDEENSAQILGSGLTGSATSRAPPSRSRTTAHSTATSFPDNIPFRGIVYFSDIHQLRSAHLEMQDFRVFSNYNNSRGGSFGQAHSVSFLAVGYEPDETSEEQVENEGAFPTLLDVGHGIVSRVTPARRSRSGGLRVGWGTSKPPPNTAAKKETRKKRASAGLREASTLLCTLLSKPEITTAMDANDETVLVSLINNQRCVDVFKYLSCSPPYSKYQKPLIPSDFAKDLAIPVNEPLDIVKPDTPTSEKSDGDGTSSTLWRPFSSDSTRGPVLRFGEGSKTIFNESKVGVVDLEPPSLSQEKCKRSETCFLHGIDYLSGYDLVHNAFMNWPAQVTTVLGFNPFVPHETTPTPISTQKLDTFVKYVLVSNENSFATAFLYNLSHKINELLAKGEDIMPVYEKGGDLDGMNETNLPMYVGVRYLGALVRALALEHSRVKGTLVELPPTRELPDRLRSQEIKGKLVHDTMKKSLTSFSWLAIDALAKAAETASMPVRMGVAKPFSASSVTNDCHTGRVNTSSRAVGDRSRHRSLDRQFHVRHALPDDLSTTRRVPTRLPITGIRLVPQQHGNQSGIGEEHDEFGMDLSDSDVPGSELGNDSFDASRSRPAQGGRAEVYIHDDDRSIINSSSSDEDDPFADIVDGGIGRRGNHRNRRDGEDGMEGMYPYAWALDGRRIGENTPVIRASSPTSSFFGQSEITTPLSTIPSIRFGSGFLARTFARIIKDLVTIVVKLCTSKRTPLYLIELPRDVSQNLLRSALETIEKTWSWVTGILDVAEGQLQHGKGFDTQRYVAALRGSVRAFSSSASPSVVQRIISRTANRSFIGSTPGEYMSYLLQCQTVGNQGSIPVIDLYGYEHVVYILDGLLYTLDNWPRPEIDSLLSEQEPSPAVMPDDQKDKEDGKEEEMETEQSKEKEKVNEEETEKDDNEKEEKEKEDIEKEDKEKEDNDEEGKEKENKEEGKDGKDEEEQKKKDESDNEDRLIIRTESEEERVRRYNAEFFGTATSPIAPKGPLEEAFPLAKQPHLLQPYALKEELFSSPRPVGEEDKEAMSTSEPVELPISYMQLENRSVTRPITLVWSMDDAIKRWNTCVGVFAHIFLAEGPGSEKFNFLNNRAGFASRMARFRHQVSQLFDSTQGGRSDWASVSNTLSLRVRREHLLEDALEYLGQLTKYHYSQVRVKFEGEDGSGPGVNRGFFAAFANALKTLDITVPPCNKIGGLFYQPGKEPEQSGLYAPQPLIVLPSMSSGKQAVVRSQRMTAFRAIGRFFGLCFWFKHTIPFMMCRHVAKYILDRDFAWHDLAFYNADLYEGLRRMMIDAKSGKSNEEFHATYCCYFEAPVASHKLAGQNPENVFKDLITGGSKIPVTPDRVEEYVRLYAMYVMLGCVREELMAIRSGLIDIIPSELLIGLTPEDFQLLLSGDSASISLQRLKSVMKFNHTHGRSANICDRFEKMFWRVVSHMNNNQRQQLLYFATGSASLPASNDQEPSSVSINIDVIGGSNVESLPVASTCSLRMSIPLYPSYNTLKRKLMQAIQCQAYGLG